VRLLLSNFLQPPRQFLGAFEKLRKAIISFVTSVCPSIYLSVRMKQLISHWTDFHKIWYLNIFRKSVEKLQGFMVISRWIFLRMRNISGKSCRENQNTHFTLKKVFPENCALYEIIWKIWYSPSGHRWK